MKILIIEDEKLLLQSITTSLEKEMALVETASDFHSALEKLLMYNYDCILLDIMLPNGSGLDLLNELKRAKKTGNIIIISAKDSLDDKLHGLELGADDYLTKPFHLAELNARIKAVVRRKNFDGNDSVILRNVRLDHLNRICWIDSKLVQLRRKEFDILNYLLLNKSRLVTKNSLAEHVWGDNTDQADNLEFVYYQIKNLRKKLLDNNAEIAIESVYGIGYKLVENETSQ